MNGANLGWPSSLNISVAQNIINDPSNSNVWRFGFVNGAPPLFGSIIGFFFSDPFGNLTGSWTRWRCGRRRTLFIAGIFSFGATLGSAFVKTWWQLVICRSILGVGMGSKATIVPILLSETAPKRIRGMMVTNWQLFDSLGIFLGFAANLAVCTFDFNEGWRYMLAIAAIPALLLLTLVPFCVESPRWLLKQGAGSGQEAFRTLVRLHYLPSPIVACGDLLKVHEFLYEETEWSLAPDPQPSRTPLPHQQQYRDWNTEIHIVSNVDLKTRWRLMLSRQRMRT